MGKNKYGDKWLRLRFFLTLPVVLYCSCWIVFILANINRIFLPENSQ